jgi:hypothetical protein
LGDQFTNFLVIGSMATELETTKVSSEKILKEKGLLIQVE